MRVVFSIFLISALHFSFLAQIQQPVTHYNKVLIAMLDSILSDDQKYRLLLEKANKKFDYDSKEVQEIVEIIQNKDKVNLIKVKGILDQYGWLGADVIGENGNEALFLTIQHSDQSTQKKYLPMMREAVKKGKAQGSALALLEDRVAIGQGKKQIYGSQIIGYYGKYRFSPIEDEINVNKRRASVGLEPIEDYAKNFGFVYKMEDPNLSEDNMFWQKYSIVLSLAIIILMFSLILFLLFKFKQLVWFWLLLLFFVLQLIMLPVDYYSSYSIVDQFKGNAILFLFMREVSYCVVIFMITFAAFKLFKFKHIFLDLISIFIAVYICARFLNKPLLNIFLPESGLIFRFNIFEPSVYSAVFLIISFVLLRISYKKKKREAMESVNANKVV